jgi:hypothetical protein
LSNQSSTFSCRRDPFFQEVLAVSKKLNLIVFEKDYKSFKEIVDGLDSDSRDKVRVLRGANHKYSLVPSAKDLMDLGWGKSEQEVLDVKKKLAVNVASLLSNQTSLDQ